MITVLKTIIEFATTIQNRIIEMVRCYQIKIFHRQSHNKANNPTIQDSINIRLNLKKRFYPTLIEAIILKKYHKTNKKNQTLMVIIVILYKKILTPSRIQKKRMEKELFNQGKILIRSIKHQTNNQKTISAVTIFMLNKTSMIHTSIRI
jgi:hypothetical protein